MNFDAASLRGLTWMGVTHRNGLDSSNEALEATHKKRLAMILRYIATMHHSADGPKGISFVRNGRRAMNQPDYGQDEDVLFSTVDFQRVSSIDHDGSLFSSPPFSFYAATATSDTRKRTVAGTIKNSISPSKALDYGQACWLRLTRLVLEAPPRITPAVRRYLTSWKERAHATTIRELLTLERISQAPKVAPGLQLTEIKLFLRQYKLFLRRSSMRTSLEPLYNRLFEWLQQQNEQDLVWGFGNAKMYIQELDLTINGPLLEVLVEVELSRDGALLVRPRPHTGVTLNREVVASLTLQDARSHDLLSSLHRTVSELETYQLSPGQPSTYAPLLKRMAVELSSGGIFVSSSTGTIPHDHSSLTVTDTWCIFHRSKPSTVWARDASVLAERVFKDDTVLPLAALSLTHGPGALEFAQPGIADGNIGKVTPLLGVLNKVKSVFFATTDPLPVPSKRPLLPLPTSEAQNRIADLLLTRQCPAIVCEGPPGTGKTHTIANIVCAYLCQGKRVLVTSKSAPALSVLRQRLPNCVQELCVDVSMSESTGIRQLQQTVELLADRVSCISADVHEEQCRLLQRNIEEIENEIKNIDIKLRDHSERKRKIMHSRGGDEFMEIALELVSTVPWLMKTVATWTVAETNVLVERAESVFTSATDSIERVTGFESPPSDALISLAASKTGETVPYLKSAAVQALASLPVLGSISKMDQYHELLSRDLNAITLAETVPKSRMDWKLVLCALRRDKAIHDFHNELMEELITRDNWPVDEIYDTSNTRKRLRKGFLDRLTKVSRLKELAWIHNIPEEIQNSIEVRKLDCRRNQIVSIVQRLAEDLVEATVVTELCRMFSSDAQSALIRFAQIAGKAKFSKSSQTAKMSHRQRRHRQEYLDMFEKCVRYIPCWILTSSQISDYLPPEFGLFDLVIVDEASQSDVTVLPGMLRGKQWLIVGDGKQVSPSENFVSESHIESLRAALPESPLKDSLLPGRSFFDLCAQAFPKGRVVLSEHFRCAPEIIDFSNEQFYSRRLIPLRLPTASERLSPSIIDIRVKNSTKVGKVNEGECDTIVKLIEDFVAEHATQAYCRSIGVISLVGDEQSRLIRGRLLDAIGPQKYKEHNILVGDPPTFQGAERDIIFLSMVCSPGSVPTQSQQMHAQRANVALSRARDRIILVRSIDASHIPSGDDIKLPIIEFFTQGYKKEQGINLEELPTCTSVRPGILSWRVQVEQILEQSLRERGFCTARMGVVWSDAICVENDVTGRRAAICIDGAGESTEQWTRLVAQQKSIERVGWKSLRVDAISFIFDFYRSMEFVEVFLHEAGVEPIIGENVDNPIEIMGGNPLGVDMNVDEPEVNIIDGNAEDHSDSGVVVISSDDEDDDITSRDATYWSPPRVSRPCEINGESNEIDPEQFGDVVDLEFLRYSTASVEGVDQHDMDDIDKTGQGKTLYADEEVDVDNIDVGASSATMDLDEKVPVARETRHGEHFSDDSDEGQSLHGGKRRRKSYRRLEKYARDARWYPGQERDAMNDHCLETGWYDVDSDLRQSSLHSTATSVNEETQHRRHSGSM